jgi:hypothetical protein
MSGVTTTSMVRVSWRQTNTQNRAIYDGITQAATCSITVTTPNGIHCPRRIERPRPEFRERKRSKGYLSTTPAVSAPSLMDSAPFSTVQASGE